jgi:hypothetical protein
MNDIVTLLRASTTATAPNQSKPPPTTIPKPNHIHSPRVSAITQDRSPSLITPSYSDTIRNKVPPPSIPTSAPIQAPIRGLRPNGSSSLPQDFDGGGKSPMVQRHRRRQDYISGHYWHNCQFDIHDGKGYPRFQVAWLHHNIDGPNEGKPDKLQKVTLSLADDSTKSFLRFYAAARSDLGACGYHEELLPTLSTARVGFDVRDTPIVDEDLITVGKTMEIDEPPREHWQGQHDTLGMNLYTLLEYAIKPSATRSRLLVENSATLGNPNGLTILHDLLRYHQPRVLDSIAPPFDVIYAKSPKMKKKGKGSTYDLAVDDFKARCNEWELSISMYPEVLTFRCSQHALKQLQGILLVLKSHVLPIENHVTRHYQRHRFETDEPPIDTEYSMSEAMTILKAAAHTLDQQTGLLFHGPPNVAHLDLDDFGPISAPPFDPSPNGLDAFVDYCMDTMDPASSEPMVSYIKRFQNRGRETGPAKPCKHAACSRTHPVNECCIYRGPHFVNRCWHVLGLPDGIAAIKDNFKKQHTANDGPWKRGQQTNDRGRQFPQNNDRSRPPLHQDRQPRSQDRNCVSAALIPHYKEQQHLQPELPMMYSTVLNNLMSTIQSHAPRTGPRLSSLRFARETTPTPTRNTNSTPSVEQEAIDYVQEEPLQGYRSPLVNHFMKPPNVSSILCAASPLLRPLPDDGPAINDELLDSLYHEMVVSHVAISLPSRGTLKHANYVCFHLDTGATCTVSHCSGEAHCPTPTSVKCGTGAADGPLHVVESLGYLIGDFETSNSTMIPFEIPDHATIPSFKRRSMSLHALKDIGFDVTHSLLAQGNFLTIRRAGTDERFQSVPLVTHGRSDYVRIKNSTNRLQLA